MLGNTLVTIQTGDAGKQVNRLYVTDGVDIAKEFYLALLVNRATGRVSMVVSTEGGMDIETVAHDTPEKIQTIDIDPGDRLHAASRSRGRRRARPDRRSRQAGGERRVEAVRRVPRHRCRADRDQPARRHRRRQAAGARRQGRVRRQCDVPPQGPDGTARRDRGRSRRSSRRRSTTSPTSSSTATSAAWSTARASPWRRWTSSS